MSITMKRQGKAWFVAGDNINSLTVRGIKKAWYYSGLTVKKEAQNEILNGRKTGRVYRVRIKGILRRHRSSASGESHAEITGKLRRSLGYLTKGTDQLEFGYGVSSAKQAPKYAKFVELTLDRRTLQNAIDASEGKITAHFEREIGKRLQGKKK